MGYWILYSCLPPHTQNITKYLTVLDPWDSIRREFFWWHLSPKHITLRWTRGFVSVVSHVCHGSGFQLHSTVLVQRSRRKVALYPLNTLTFATEFAALEKYWRTQSKHGDMPRIGSRVHPLSARRTIPIYSRSYIILSNVNECYIMLYIYIYT